MSVQAAGYRAEEISQILGEYILSIDEWLEADRKVPSKQRHSAARIHQTPAKRNMALPAGGACGDRRVRDTGDTVRYCTITAARIKSDGL